MPALVSIESHAMSDVMIVEGARTPMGGFQGALSDAKATDLGAAAEFTAGGKHLGVKLGECPHDPLYCPPEKDLLPGA